MTTTIRAVFQAGMLRPLQPLDLTEGETVEVTVARDELPLLPLSEEELIQRIQSAQTISEWVEATKLLPADDGGYDIVKALNDNRIWSGERPLLSPEEKSP